MTDSNKRFEKYRELDAYGWLCVGLYYFSIFGMGLTMFAMGAKVLINP